MAIKQLNLSELEKEPQEVREAIAFYTSFTVIPFRFTSEERERYYRILEQAGYLEKVGGHIEHKIHHAG